MPSALVLYVPSKELTLVGASDNAVSLSEKVLIKANATLTPLPLSACASNAVSSPAGSRSANCIVIAEDEQEYPVPNNSLGDAMI